MSVNRPRKEEQLSADPIDWQVGKIEQFPPLTLPPFEPTKLVFFQDERQQMQERIAELEAENAKLRAKEGIPPLNDVLEIARFISGLQSYINNLEMIIYTSVGMTDIMREAIPNGEEIYKDINKRWSGQP